MTPSASARSWTWEGRFTWIQPLSEHSKYGTHVYCCSRLYKFQFKVHHFHRFNNEETHHIPSSLVFADYFLSSKVSMQLKQEYRIGYSATQLIEGAIKTTWNCIVNPTSNKVKQDNDSGNHSTWSLFDKQNQQQLPDRFMTFQHCQDRRRLESVCWKRDVLMLDVAMEEQLRQQWVQKVKLIAMALCVLQVRWLQRWQRLCLFNVS